MRWGLFDVLSCGPEVLSHGFAFSNFNGHTIFH